MANDVPNRPDDATDPDQPALDADKKATPQQIPVWVVRAAPVVLLMVAVAAALNIYTVSRDIMGDEAEPVAPAAVPEPAVAPAPPVVEEKAPPPKPKPVARPKPKPAPRKKTPPPPPPKVVQPPPPMPSANASSSLSFAVTGGSAGKGKVAADVYLDGKRIGRAPISGYAVVPGSHRVRFDCIFEGKTHRGKEKVVDIPSFTDAAFEHKCDMLVFLGR